MDYSVWLGAALFWETGKLQITAYLVVNEGHTWRIHKMSRNHHPESVYFYIDVYSIYVYDGEYESFTTCSWVIPGPRIDIMSGVLENVAVATNPEVARQVGFTKLT